MPREWTRLCADVLKRPELSTDDRFATNPQRVKHREALAAEIAQVAGGLTSTELIARLDAARHRLRAHELDGRLHRAPTTQRARPLA